MPKQEVLTGTLAGIVEDAENEDFKPPAIILVGEVVELREKLQWFEKKPLFGKRILVTRSRSQASDLVDLVERKGAEAIEFPTIKIEPPPSYKQLDSAIGNLSKYQWVIFTSANGVDFFFDRLQALGKDLRELKGIKIAAIGPATANRLAGLQLIIDYVPSEYKAEAVIEGFKEFALPGLNVLIPRAEVAREILPQQLREMNINVDVATAYRTVSDSSKVEEIKALLEKQEIDIVTFTSSSTVKNFVKLLRDLDLSKILENIKVACIGPITANTVHALGLRVDIEAEEYTIHGLVAAICEFHDFP